jgi:predicted dehydrogenase
VLVVGAGFMGRLHARTLRGSRQARLSGVVDRSEPVASAVGAELGVPGFTDLERAIRQTRPDAVVIATPDPAHRAPAEAAIAAGLALLVEKPLATTVEDAEAIAALAAERGTRLLPGHLLRFDLRYAHVAEAVRAGAVGRPVLLTAARFGLTSLGARVGHLTSPLWHFLIHDLDAVQWVSGGVVQEIDAAVRIDSPAGPSAFAATGRLSTGAAFQLTSGWTLPEGSLSPQASLEVHGEQGHVRLAGFEDGPLVSGGTRAYRADGAAWPTVRGRVEGALRREAEHFLSALIDGSPFAVTPEEAVAAVRAAAACEAATVTTRLP